MEEYKNIEICKEHNQKYELICCCITCNVPLCNLCTTAHELYHKQENTRPSIFPLTELLHHSKTQSNIWFEEFLASLKVFENKYISDQQLNLEKILDRIKKIREDALSIVYNYFDNLESQVQQLLLIQNKESSLVLNSSEPLKKQISELDSQRRGLDTENWMESLFKFIAYDHQKNFAQEIAAAEKRLNNIFFKTELQEDPQGFLFLSESLSQSAGLNIFRMETKEQKRFEKNNLPKNFFELNCNKKILHFFADGTKMLRLFDLKTIQNTAIACKTYPLDIDFKIPSWHKSLITSSGDIFLTGGVDSETKQETNEVFQLDFEKFTLRKKNSMLCKRYGHELVLFKGKIYAIGGGNDDEGILNSCECYDINNDEWKKCGGLEAPSLGCCATVFNEVLVKFGGLKEDNMYNNSIEIYHEIEDKWEKIEFNIEQRKGLFDNEFNLLWGSACVQISDKEIFVFGGYEIDNFNTGSSFVFEKNEKEWKIKEINKYFLPYCEGFWNNQAIVYNDEFYCLQNVNITTQINSDKNLIETITSANKRKMLRFCFLEERWEEINIV